MTQTTGNGAGLTWILGSSRSGSTWLLRMLGELPALATIDDPHIGHHLGTWRPISLAWGVSDEEPELQTLRSIKRHKPGYFFNERYEDAWRPALRELIRVRFAAEADEQVGPECAGIVVKEPGSQEAELLLSLFPESKLIFLLRDGRDVVDSWADAYSSGSWAIDEGAFAADPGGREALVRWQSSVWAFRTAAVREAYERRDPSDRLLVRYEDLLAEPVRELGRIAHLLGLDCDPKMLEEVASAHRFSALPSNARGHGCESRSASPGGWRGNLTAREQSEMKRIMGDELRRFGYLQREHAVA